MIPIRPLRKYHDFEGEEDGLPLTGLRKYLSVQSPRALERLTQQRKRQKRLKQQKAKA